MIDEDSRPSFDELAEWFAKFRDDPERYIVMKSVRDHVGFDFFGGYMCTSDLQIVDVVCTYCTYMNVL